MKKFFSLFLVVALVIVAMMFVACDEEPAETSITKVTVEGPAIDNPASEEHHEHLLGTPKVVPATCISEGYTEYVCMDPECNYVYRDTYNTDENAHNFEVYNETVSATCQVAKKEQSTCTLCGYVGTKIGETVDHNYTVLVEDVPATCTVDGHLTQKCEWCEKTKTTPYVAEGHSFTELVETVDAKCTVDGYTINKCANCEETKTSIIDAIGHNMGAWEVYIPNINEYGQCVDGTDIQYCQNEGCHYEQTRKNPMHSNSTKVVVDPTCTTVGYTEYTCQNPNCNLVYYGDWNDRVDEHVYGDWQDYEGYEGYEVNYCTICGYAWHREIKKTED